MSEEVSPLWSIEDVVNAAGSLGVGELLAIPLVTDGAIVVARLRAHSASGREELGVLVSEEVRSFAKRLFRAWGSGEGLAGVLTFRVVPSRGPEWEVVTGPPGCIGGHTIVSPTLEEVLAGKGVCLDHSQSLLEAGLAVLPGGAFGTP